MRIGEEFKAELETIRSEKLKHMPVAADEWWELSDPRLCKNPLVSVFMTAYNQEQYIRKALDSILSQRCDFEYEIVIGEDQSTDQTLAICKEYLKAHPDKIRILQGAENTVKRYGTHLVNSYRVLRASRGEFEAWLEGDDYWIDDSKLSRQVEIMRNNPSVGMIYTGANLEMGKTGEIVAPATWRKEGIVLQQEIWSLLQHREYAGIYTATMFWRRAAFIEEIKHYAIYEWPYEAGDIILQNLLASHWNFYYLPQRTAVYRTGVGISAGNGERLHLETIGATAYFGMVFDKAALKKHPLYHRAFRTRLLELYKRSPSEGKHFLREVLSDRFCGCYFRTHPVLWFYAWVVRYGARGQYITREGFWRVLRDKFRSFLPASK